MGKPGEKAPGIVLVNTFCQSSDKYFTGYIGYMDRPAAVRRSHIKDYDIFSGYMNYMGNPIKTEQSGFEEPEKISGLFTDYTDLATADDTEKIKNEFRKAQDNGSLMWQTVISFRNDWLEKMNVYHVDTGILDEKRLKGATRKAVNKMLEKEELANAVWTAAIHYNTDNIHIHIAAVEPQPQRRKKLYPQYEIEHQKGKWQYKKMQDPETGIWRKVPILDEQGDILMKEEYVGRFKESSLKAAKSALLEDLTLNKDINREINEIIRERILRNLRDSELYEDQEFRQSFISICEALPENKGVCNYGNNAMASLREQIDELSTLYIEKYHKDDFEDLQRKLQLRDIYYREVYGDSNNNYKENKLQDLYYRMGNAILKEARQFDLTSSQVETKLIEEAREPLSEATDTLFEDIFPGEVTFEEQEKDGENGSVKRHRYYVDWRHGYQDARKAIYKEKEYEKAIEKLQKMAADGNVLAIAEMGNMYHFGRGVEANEEIANQYYAESLEGFCYLIEHGEKIKYCAYRAGKQYLYGQGTEINYEEAAKYLIIASKAKNPYAMYLLGNLYWNGEGVERDFSKAVSLYETAAALDNPYAAYKLGQLYERGEAVEVDREQSENYYADALKGFLTIEDKDENMLYRIGTMYLKGKGTEVDLKTAVEYLERAAELGNDMAMYQLGKIYIASTGNPKMYARGIDYMYRAAAVENPFAQYEMGRLSYMAGDKESAKTWYAASAAQGNAYAAKALNDLNKPVDWSRNIRYSIAKNEADIKKALYWLRKSLDYEYEKYINLQDYEKLQQSIEENKDIEL